MLALREADDRLREKLRVSLRQLRYWHDRHLVRAARRDGTHLWYNLDGLRTLSLIARLRREGISTQLIGRVIRAIEDDAVRHLGCQLSQLRIFAVGGQVLVADRSGVYDPFQRQVIDPILLREAEREAREWAATGTDDR